MSTWFVGARDLKLVYEAEDAMKSWPAECDDMGKDAWVAFLRKNGRWDDAVCAAVEHPRIFIDGGGSIQKGEPKVLWETGGCRMKTYVRHLPFVLERFKSLQPIPDLPGLVGFGGFCRKYFFSQDLVTDSVQQMERLLRGTESLRQELELGVQKIFNEAAGALSARKCGCMSGEMYGDCCGKFVETADHRELRKGANAEETPE